MKETLDIAEGFVGNLWYSDLPKLDRLHRHDELECNIVTSGHGAYLLQGHRVDLQPNTIFWLFPAQEHLILDSSDDFNMWILVIKPEALHRLCASEFNAVLLEQNPPGNFLRHLHPPQIERLVALCQEIMACDADTARYNAGLEYLLLSAWSAFQDGSVVPLNTHIHPAVDKIARQIHAGHLDDNLATLATLVDLTPESVSRLFKKQTGVSLSAFRNRCRVDRFLTIYGQGHSITMLNAALEAGFGSYAQFYRVFTQVMKLTPAAYRRELRGDG